MDTLFLNSRVLDDNRRFWHTIYYWSLARILQNTMTKWRRSWLNTVPNLDMAIRFPTESLEKSRLTTTELLHAILSRVTGACPNSSLASQRSSRVYQSSNVPSMVCSLSVVEACRNWKLQETNEEMSVECRRLSTYPQKEGDSV